MGQLVESHITVTEDDPHHGKATHTIKTMDDIWVIDLLDGENFGCIGQNREGQVQRFFGFYSREYIYNVLISLEHVI